MNHRIYLNFVIEGFEDVTHDDISTQLGIQPYEIFKKGEKRFRPPSSSAVWKFNRWIMPAPLDEYSSFEEHLNATLDIIEPKIDLFRPICEKYRCEFRCAIYLYFGNGESIPSVFLDSRYHEFIRKLNADVGFDFDLYMFPNDP
jgi:hypothetical protein